MAFKIVIIGQGKPPPPAAAQTPSSPAKTVSKTASGEDETFTFSGEPIVEHEPTGTTVRNRMPNTAGGNRLQPVAMFLALGVQFYVIQEDGSK